MKAKINDRICSIIFFAFGTAIMVCIPKYIEGRKYDPLGSRFFPYVIAWSILLISVMLFVSTFNSKKYPVESGETYRINVPDNLRTVLYCIALLISIFLMEKVHFLVGAFVMLTSMLLLCRTKKISSYLIVYACSYAAYFIFTRYFNVRL